MPHIAFIALGSNLGDREKILRAALRKLDQPPDVRVMKVSSFLDNPAVGGPVDSPPFLNAAAEVETTLEARLLMHRLLEIERSLGRHRSEKWGPRSIDLDLLLFDDQIIEGEGLTVPHPLMHQRRFVLQPLAEIAGEAVHPRYQKTIRQLLEATE